VLRRIYGPKIRERNIMRASCEDNYQVKKIKIKWAKNLDTVISGKLGRQT
jgi:hypothetical protein